MEFLCSQCGACCRRAGIWEVAKYGLPIKKDGSCGHLKNNLCSIYEERPLICRAKEFGIFIKKRHSNFNIKQWYIDQTKECHKLIDEDGLDDSYKIDIKDYN